MEVQPSGSSPSRRGYKGFILLWVLHPGFSVHVCVTVCGFNAGLANEKDGRSSAMSEAEGLDEEDDEGDEDEEGGAETEEQSGNESEMNEQEEDVRPFVSPG